VVFSPDGRHLALGRENGTLDVIPVLPNRPVVPSDEPSLDQVWSALQGRQASIAWEAISHLRRHPSKAIAFLEKHPCVVPSLAKKDVQPLINGLDAESYSTRKQAFARLQDVAHDHEDLLREALQQSKSVEARKRLHLLLNPPPSIHIRSAEALRALRTVQTLELIGSSDAKSLLRKLANSESALIANTARASLQRLAQPQGAKGQQSRTTLSCEGEEQ